MSVEWWRNAIIYQIYPRSFQDSNNDGIGDLRGITRRLDYVADLGVDGIWISPFFKSPMKDFGYDVSDYRDIDPMFGTLQDFDDLLEKAHRLGLKVIVDLVLSHTSDQHPWFSDPAKKDWYVWADGKDDGNGNSSPPNNWVSVFGGSAWEYCPNRKQYYLHNFLTEQPDLNFHDPHVQEEMLDICRFWLERGVDGFRLDTVNFYFHDRQLRDNPPRTPDMGYATQLEADVPYSRQQHIYDKSRPENIAFIERMRFLADGYQDRVLIGEIGDDHPYQLAQDYTRGKNRLHTTYNPQLMSGTQKELTEDLIRIPVQTFFNQPDTDESNSGWPAWAFSNHDVVRAASRWYKPYDQNPCFSKLLIALLGCLPGMLFLYQGEELGLPEAEIPHDAIQDPWAKETWPTWQGRDGCRTPFPWDNTNFCGFSEKIPWLPISESHKTLNMTKQKNNRDSVLNFTKSFIQWRNMTIKNKDNTIEFMNTTHSHIIKIKIKSKNIETHCIFNVSDKIIPHDGKNMQPFEVHIDGFNYPDTEFIE